MAQIIAHRGARENAPENTLPAFEKALSMGVDGIELDVQCSSDGALVLMHDFSLERTTDGAGPVSDRSLADLQQLDAGAYFDDSFAGVQIPTLDQVIDLVGKRCLVNIEIKSVDYLGGVEADAVARLVAKRDLYRQVIVSSFNPVTLVKMRQLDARILLGLLYGAPLPDYLLDLWLGPSISPDALHPHCSLVDKAYMTRSRKLGKNVNVWTVNEVQEARRLDALGVNAIITDAPDRILAGLAAEDAG